jgi:hypothetical protein
VFGKLVPNRRASDPLSRCTKVEIRGRAIFSILWRLNLRRNCRRMLVSLRESGSVVIFVQACAAFAGQDAELATLPGLRA